MFTTSAVPHELEEAEALLEDYRTLILGGILVAEDFDYDDLPIADRIAAAGARAGHYEPSELAG